MDDSLTPGYVRCEVRHHASAWLVTFINYGRDMLLQSDYDQAAFAVSCGLIPAPRDWTGCPSTLGEVWLDVDPTEIVECPDDYLWIGSAVAI